MPQPTLADDMERVAQAARDYDRADICRLERIGFGSSSAVGRFPAGVYRVPYVRPRALKSAAVASPRTQRPMSARAPFEASVISCARPASARPALAAAQNRPDAALPAASPRDAKLPSKTASAAPRVPPQLPLSAAASFEWYKAMLANEKRRFEERLSHAHARYESAQRELQSLRLRMASDPPARELMRRDEAQSKQRERLGKNYEARWHKLQHDEAEFAATVRALVDAGRDNEQLHRENVLLRYDLARQATKPSTGPPRSAIDGTTMDHEAATEEDQAPTHAQAAEAEWTAVTWLSGVPGLHEAIAAALLHPLPRGSRPSTTKAIEDHRLEKAFLHGRADNADGDNDGEAAMLALLRDGKVIERLAHVLAPAAAALRRESAASTGGDDAVQARALEHEVMLHHQERPQVRVTIHPEV